MTNTGWQNLIGVPWSDATVEALNAYQQRRDTHPYTCGTSGCGAILVAKTDGWHCPKCDYRQYWALSFITSPQGDER